MRQLDHEMVFPVRAEELFSLLVTPSAIRGWWSAARVIVMPWTGGLWVAAWGENEDDPDYITAARITTYAPPRRLILTEYQYHAKSGPLPFEAQFANKFLIDPAPGGTRLHVVHTGFPDDPAADDFLNACREGWRNTFEGIRRYLGALPERRFEENDGGRVQ